MTLKTFFSFVLFFAAFTTSITLKAQSGSIAGKVTESFAGSIEPVIGAIVNIEGTSMATVTDTAGQFLFANVPVGKYNLKISYVGYTPKIVKGVEVLNNETANLPNIRIEEDVKTTEEVEIIGTRNTSTDVSLITEIKTLEVVASGISNEQIKRTMDRDAADVARRVAGVSVADNRFVIVRGLAERYNAVMLNNALAPSFEQDVKSFSLDNITSQFIDRMVVYKSPSPDLPGDFAGGVVKIYTHGMPAKNNLSIGFSSSYRENTTFQDFKGPVGGKYSWLGYDDGTYGYPTSVPPDFGVTTQNKYNLFEVGKQFRHDTWLPRESRANPDMRLNLNWGQRIKLGESKMLGLVTGINYSNQYQKIYDAQRAMFIAAYKEDGKTVDQFIPGFDGNYQTTWWEENNQRIVRLGVIQNFILQLNAKNSFDFKNTYSHVGYNQFRNLHVINGFQNAEDFAKNPEKETYHSRTSIWNTYGGILSSQLSGKHAIFKNTDLNWLVGHARAERNEPDIKNYEYSKFPNNSQRKMTWYQAAGGAASPFYFGRYFFKTQESVKTASADVSNSQRLDLFKITLKSGFYIEEKRRDFGIKSFAYTGNARAGLQPDGTEPTYNDGIFSYDNLKLENLNLAETWNNPNGLVLVHSGNDGAYNARTMLFAYYGMATINFNEKVTVGGGMRLENYTQTIYKQLFYQNWLPSINASYNITKKWLVRGSFGKTINRPEIREAAPLRVFDFYLLRAVEGNESLKPSVINNYDLRLEFYPSPDEMLSIGAFNKDFRDPIERIFIAENSGNPYDLTLNFVNAKQAYSRGIEVEVRKSLRNLLILKDRDILGNFSFLFNAAIIKSEVIYDSVSENNLYTRPKPLLGQSPYMINSALTYNNDKQGWMVNLSYNIIGKRLVAVLPGAGNIYEVPRHALDLTLTKSIGKYVEVKFGIQDLINQKIQFMQDLDGDGKVKRTSGTGYQDDYRKDHYVNSGNSISSQQTNNPSDPYILGDTQFIGFRRGRYFTLGVSVKF